MIRTLCGGKGVLSHRDTVERTKQTLGHDLRLIEYDDA
jgi:hypothetical protein